ncbi:MAG: ribosomal-processing cysteine protease Prp, partial [Clostridia bacterium]|nr:ribosomal-processing cysteine protease Prp [Clostridia bacterium]
IVCATVTAITDFTIGILEKFSVDTRLEIREDTAYVLCEICETESNAAKESEITKVLDGFVEYIKDVSDVYPKNVKCVITQN